MGPKLDLKCPEKLELKEAAMLIFLETYSSISGGVGIAGGHPSGSCMLLHRPKGHC